jgi:hypothetical protein
MEDNIPVEQIVETAEAPVSESVVEQFSEQTAEAPVEQDNLQIDLSDFDNLSYQPQAPVPSQSVDQNRDIVEEIAARLAQRLQPAVEQQYQDPGQEEMVTKAEMQRLLYEMQEKQKAEAMIQETIKQSEKVQNTYAERLTNTLMKNGIDLAADEALKLSCDRRMYMQKVEQLGRNAPILTPAETKELASQHFEAFKNIYLKNKIQRPQTNTQPLSAVGNAVNHQAQSPKAPDEFSQFLEKKKNGTVTMSDIANILARPTQKK